MGGAALEDDSMTGAMSAAVYSGTDYVLLLFVILSTVLVIIGAISLMSGLAKSVKEAGTMVSPLMIVVMLIGVSTMFGDGAPKEVYWYLIPFYNSVQCMNGIFSFDLVPVNFVVTIAKPLYALVMHWLVGPGYRARFSRCQKRSSSRKLCTVEWEQIWGS